MVREEKRYFHSVSNPKITPGLVLGTRYPERSETYLLISTGTLEEANAQKQYSFMALQQSIESLVAKSLVLPQEPSDSLITVITRTEYRTQLSLQHSLRSGRIYFLGDEQFATIRNFLAKNIGVSTPENHFLARKIDVPLSVTDFSSLYHTHPELKSR